LIPAAAPGGFGSCPHFGCPSKPRRRSLVPGHPPSKSGQVTSGMHRYSPVACWNRKKNPETLDAGAGQTPDGKRNAKIFSCLGRDSCLHVSRPFVCRR
jgi:hypothetical protein